MRIRTPWSIVFFFVGKLHLTCAAHARKRPVQVVPRRSNSYDKQVTTFDPQGNLLQLEYAQRAASRGSFGLFFHLGDCIIAVLESSSEEEKNKSLSRIHDGMLVKMTGLQGDSRILAKYLLQNALQMEWMEGQIHEAFSCVRVKQIADICAEVQHSLTTRPGARPLAVDAVLFGIDGIVLDEQAHMHTCSHRSLEGQNEHGYYRNKLGLYKCNLSGVVDTCNFCMVGNIISDRVLYQDAIQQLDALWRKCCHDDATSSSRPNVSNEDNQKDTTILESSTDAVRTNVIQTMSNIAFKHLRQQQSRKEESSKFNNKSTVDLCILKSCPRSRGGVKIYCATCVKQEDLDYVCTTMVNSMNEEN
jgi:20S proteasome, alpha and beta subunits